MSAVWYRWGDASFTEITDPRDILEQDAPAALDEAEGSFYWAPQTSFQLSDYRNDGMGPVQLSEVQSRAQAVLADADIIQTASAAASFDRRANRLIVDCSVDSADLGPLSLQLTDDPQGFQITKA